LLAELAHRKGLELSLVERDGLADAHLVDATRLKQVVVNLVGNAIKFTDAGEVVVELSAVGDPVAPNVRIAVSDTGIGIPEAARGRIFEVFTQVDGTTTRRYEGTGLGLAICKQIVEKMGGTIGVDSVLGSGSTFWLEVPLRAAEADGRNPLQDAARIAGRSVLVVDDNATNREVVRRHLEHWRIRSAESESGRDALAALRAASERGEPFDAAILDLMMPEMDGLELARQMRADPASRTVPIVLLTSVRVAERDVAELQVCARLTKPVRRVDLYDAMVTALAGAGATTAPVAAAERPRAVRALRVLVVEDNRSISA
jgi:two-component system sensor histidine kinase/response regulator